MWASWLQIKWREGILAPSWLQVGAKLGPSYVMLGPSWGQVGAQLLGQLGASWSQVGAKLEPNEWGQDEAKIGLRAPALDSAVASYSDFKMRHNVLLNQT